MKISSIKNLLKKPLDQRPIIFEAAFLNMTTGQFITYQVIVMGDDPVAARTLANEVLPSFREEEGDWSNFRLRWVTKVGPLELT